MNHALGIASKEVQVLMKDKSVSTFDLLINNYSISIKKHIIMYVY